MHSHVPYVSINPSLGRHLLMARLLQCAPTALPASTLVSEGLFSRWQQDPLNRSIRPCLTCTSLKKKKNILTNVFLAIYRKGWQSPNPPWPMRSGSGSFPGL